MEENILNPIWQENYSVIAMSSSEEYLPYLSVCLQSLVDNASEDHNYDIILFSSSKNGVYKREIVRSFSRSNISIRFFNPKEILEGIKLTVTHTYFNEACYFRIAAPCVLKNYKKVLFCDIDIIFNADVKELYSFDLGDSALAACEEPIWKIFIKENTQIKWVNIREYSQNVLKLPDPTVYYNTGVMLLNIEQFVKNNYFEKLKKLINENTFLYQEQDALNLLLNSKTKALPPEWNTEISPRLYNEYINAPLEKLKIIHWLGAKKPWHWPEIDFGYVWSKYARKTPFYEIITNRRSLFRNKIQLQEILSYKNIKYQYWRVSFLEKISFGSVRKRYKQKKSLFMEKIKNYKKIIGC